MKKHGAGASGDEDGHVSRFNLVAARHQEDLDHSLRFAGGDSGFFYRAKVALIRRHAAHAPAVILDFGCGVGTLSSLLAEAFPESRVVGFDPAADGIARARERCAAHGGRLRFQDSFEQTSLRANMVIAAGVFHHIPPRSKQSTMDRLAASLLPGGQVFVFEHNPISPLARFIVARAKVDEGATLVYPWQMTRMLRKAGLRSKLEFISFFPPFLGALAKWEPHLKMLPVSAQYVAIGTT